MITSKLTSKAQTTIPRAVRRALGLEKGDRLVYVIDGDRVILSRSSPPADEDPFATFDEWNTEADRQAFADL